jgi:hypothetical protein
MGAAWCNKDQVAEGERRTTIYAVGGGGMF